MLVVIGHYLFMEIELVVGRVLFDGDGDWFLLAAIVLVLVGLVFGLYTRSGSQIDEHPRGPRR